MRPVYVTVVLQLFPTSKKPTVFRNVPLEDALEMIAGKPKYRLIFNPFVVDTKYDLV
jgi:hypothetical protein